MNHQPILRDECSEIYKRKAKQIREITMNKTQMHVAKQKKMK